MYEYQENPTILETGEEFDESDEEDYFAEEEEVEVLGSVQEQVEAQLQNKTVAQLRKEQIENAKASLRGKKVRGAKRGRKKKG